MQNTNTEPTVEIKIAGDYTALDMMTKEQLLQYLSGHYNDSMWIFAGQVMVQPADLAEADFTTIGVIRITPALAGGTHKEESS